MEAGFARIDITPPMGIHLSGYYEARRAASVHDPLLASVCAFRDGDSLALLISLDLIGVRQELMDNLRLAVGKAVGLAREQVFIACTHTHTGPVTGGDLFPPDPLYNSRLGSLLAQAAALAVNDLSPCRLHTAVEQVPGIAFIRRFRMKDGSVRTNPGIGNPDIAYPMGQPDERLGLVRIVREGKPEILVLNFAVHADVVGGGGALSSSANDTAISADFPGFLREALEGALPGCRVLFLNGAEGDTNHIDVHAAPDTPMNGYAVARHMARCLAAGALRAYTHAKHADDGGVDAAETELWVRVNKGRPEDLPRARQIVQWHSEGRDDLIPETGMGITMLVAEAQRMIDTEDMPDQVPLRMTALRVGSVCIAGIPGEPFTEIGRHVLETSPCAMQLVACCANGYQGYFPTQDAYDEGGYEARSSSFCPGVGEMVAGAAAGLVRALFAHNQPNTISQGGTST